MTKSTDRWEKKTFEQVCEDIDKSGPEEGESFNYIEISSIDNKQKIIKEVQQLTAEEASSRAKQRLKAGDVLISKVRPALNAVAIVPNQYDGAIGTSGFYVVRSNKLLPKFIYYFVQRQKFISDMSGMATGSSYPSVNLSKIREYEIPVPSIEEQKEIVTNIESPLTRIEAGQQGIAEAQDRLDSYRKSVFREGVEGSLTEKWRSENDVTLDNGESLESPTEIPDNIVRSVPDSWVWTTVGEVIDSIRNGVYKPKDEYSDDGIACLRMYNIKDGQIVWKDIERIKLTDEEREKYQLEPGDFLVNRVNSRELVGKAAPIPKGLEECVFEAMTMRLRLDDFINSNYLGYWFYIYRRRHFTTQIKQTVGQASISQDQVKSMPLPLPPKKEQDRIVEIIEHKLSILENVSDELVRTSTISNHLRKSILSMNFDNRPDDHNKEVPPQKEYSEGQVPLSKYTEVNND